MKAPFAYYGGKERMAPWIVAQMPEHRVYVEPCLGAGSVFFAKPAVEHEIINDLDGALIAFFTLLRDQPDELIRLCAATPYARREFAAADPDEPGLTDIERARRWWVAVNASFNHVGRHTTGLAASIRKRASDAKTTDRRLARLHDVAARLRGVIIECRPAADVIQTFDSPGTLFYVDPPYVNDSRSDKTAAYRNEMTDEQHRELAAVLSGIAGIAIVSGYASGLYSELFADWHRSSRPLLKRATNGQRQARTTSTEVLWSNRPLEQGMFAMAANAHPVSLDSGDDT